MTLNRALALVGEIAGALGGEPAGDPRRACELSESLRGRGASRAAGRRRGTAAARRRAGAGRASRRGGDRGRLPDRDLGRDCENVGGRARAGDRLGRLGRGARRSPWRARHRPSCASSALPSRPPTWSSSPTSAAISTSTRPPPTARRPLRRWGRAAQALGYEYLAICDHTCTSRSSPVSRGRPAPPGRGDRGRRTSSWRRSESCAGASATSSRTARSTSRRCPRRARGAADQPPRRPALLAERSPSASSNG